jgi:hypothetical protein
MKMKLNIVTKIYTKDYYEGDRAVLSFLLIIPDKWIAQYREADRGNL